MSEAFLTAAITHENINKLTCELDKKQNELNEMNQNLEDIETGPSLKDGARRRKKTAKTIDESLTLPIKQKILDIKKTIKIIKQSMDQEKKKQAVKTANLDRWNKEFPYSTEKKIGEYARKIVKPCVDYYVKQFIDKDGDLFRLHNAVKAATLFDPLSAKDLSIIDLRKKVKELTWFEHDKHFTPEFLEKMRKEVSRYREKANEEIDWDSINPSRQYKTRLQRCMKRRNFDQGHEFDWKQDPGERACRIWEWWKTITESELPCFKMAVRIVAICQVSSCAVERVFSQLKLIDDACGSMHEDMLEVRMFCQTNGEGLSMKFNTN